LPIHPVPPNPPIRHPSVRQADQSVRSGQSGRSGRLSRPAPAPGTPPARAGLSVHGARQPSGISVTWRARLAAARLPFPMRPCLWTARVP